MLQACADPPKARYYLHDEIGIDDVVKDLGADAESADHLDPDRAGGGVGAGIVRDKGCASCLAGRVERYVGGVRVRGESDVPRGVLV